jgi:LacI family transcriptional regulator
MASIQAVARVAGVSIATASRVINNSPYPVRESTRQRVLQAVEELNYSPSSLARALVTQRTNIIGIIVHDILDPYFAEIVRGVEDVARDHGYLTIVCNSDRHIETEVNYLRMLRDYQADGVIFAGGGLNGQGVDELERIVSQLQATTRGTHIVSLAPQRFPTTMVTIDNARASRDMTGYLVELGHHSIGLISGPEHLLTSALRLEGYRQALSDANLTISDHNIVPGNFDLDSGRAAAEHFLDLDEPPTAIFATNDEMAIGCLAVLRKQGVAVPADISVVGFDDLKLLQSVDPPLTTIHVPLYELGATAMRQLLRAFAGETIEPAVTLNHRIVVRESASIPRSRSLTLGRDRDLEWHARRLRSPGSTAATD